MSIFSRKKKEVAAAGENTEAAKPAVAEITGHPVIINPNPASESSYRRHVGRAERLLLAIEKAERRGQMERAEMLTIELEQRKLAIKSFELARGRSK